MVDDNVRSLFTDNEIQMAQVIAGLVQGRALKDVAASLDIPAARIARWYRESEKFQEMLLDVTTEVVDEIRTHIKADAREAVVNLLPKAREVLEEMLESEKDQVRLAAANTVFGLTGFTEKGAAREAGGAPAVRDTGKAPPAAGD